MTQPTASGAPAVLISAVAASPVPMAVLWGPRSVLACNDSFADRLGADSSVVSALPAQETLGALWPTLAPDIARIRAGGGAVRREDVPLPGGEEDAPGSWSLALSPLEDPDDRGTVGGVLLVAVETGEYRAALERASRGEARLEALVAHLPQLVWQAHDGGEWIWASPRWRALTGLSADESLGLGWLVAVHPDDRTRVVQAWEAAPEAGRLDVSHRLLLADGTDRWFHTQAHAAPVRAGDPREWFGASSDIDDLRRLQEQQKLLLGELQHRVRNMISIVRSIARRTGETAQSVADFASHFEGRLNAFARTQLHVARHPRTGIDLEYLVAEELAACGAREGERVAIGGPRVVLRPKAAETLTLAVHELATNAVKYGALAGEAGKITVSWSVSRREDASLLTMIWQEDGISAGADRPAREGFGTELLRRTLPYDLDATVHYTVGPDAVTCRIALPLSHRALA